MATVQMDQALADRIVEKAITFCADRKLLGDVKEAALALQQGGCDLCSSFTESLVRQVCQYLGEMDTTVRAIYQIEPEFASLCPEAGARGSGGRRAGINLIAWVDRKSAALTSLSATLEAALSESRRRVGCRHASPACQTLCVQMIDDRDVQEWRGYALLANSMYAHSTLVWSRGEEGAPAAPVRGAERERPAPVDPELAPEEVLFEEARAIEGMPEAERLALDHHLRELKVALIRRIISDQLAYINLAKEWLTLSDLAEIHRRKIGPGKIGGKAAGLILASRILEELADESLRPILRIPESYFLGSDLMYVFMAMNGLMHWNDQKYKPEDQIRDEYAAIQEQFERGQFPPEWLQRLSDLLGELGGQPLIVRSSSQLEDNFGTSFAGKYDSHFCPNQGTPEENLRALTRAIAGTYASTFNPDALLYRRSKKLQDYDERMAALIQVVEGERFGRYFLPQGAGVAFSRNLYRWSPRIRREDGFARIVWGLGTRAVERVGNDFPRLVALSHPTLHPDDDPAAIHSYSQHFVDVLDLELNQLRTLTVEEVITPNYPSLRFMAKMMDEGSLITPRAVISASQLRDLVITFDEFLQRTPLAPALSRILHLLEETYHSAVDLEFTFQISRQPGPKTGVEITLLQCRPQSRLQAAGVGRMPRGVSPESIVFATSFMVPQGTLSDIRYVVFVSPERYLALPREADRKDVGRAISQLNAALPDKSFICVGHGRWGAANTELGVFVGYSDICHAGALVELSGEGIDAGPEPSLGTHFFQDLMEAQIYPIAIPRDRADTVFNRDFFYNTPNSLADVLGPGRDQGDCLRLIRVDSHRPGHHLDLVMDDENGRAVAFLAPDPEDPSPAQI
jgi:hypothetical protein